MFVSCRQFTFLTFCALLASCGPKESAPTSASPPAEPTAAAPNASAAVQPQSVPATPAPPPAPQAVAPPPISNDARASVDWSLGNSTGPDRVNCPGDYTEIPACLTQGGRACYAQKAVQRAKDGDCAGALRLMLVTQCHNAGAQTALAASTPALCGYLSTK